MTTDPRQPIGSASPADVLRSRGRTLRLVAALALIASIVTLAVSVPSMAQRVDTYHESSPRPLFAFERVGLDSFTYADRPVVISETENEDSIALTFGDESVRIPLGMQPEHPALPMLIRHEDWFQILRFAESTGIDTETLQDKIQRGEVADRLAIVTRATRPGTDGQTWGRVWRRDWTFTFYELKPDGSIDVTQRDMPASEKSMQYKSLGAAMKGEDAPERSKRELVPGTWRYQAALMIMPKGAAPDTYAKGGLDAMGWTLPATSLSILVGFLSAAVVFAPSRRSSRFRFLNTAPASA